MYIASVFVRVLSGLVDRLDKQAVHTKVKTSKA